MVAADVLSRGTAFTKLNALDGQKVEIGSWNCMNVIIFISILLQLELVKTRVIIEMHSVASIETSRKLDLSDLNDELQYSTQGQTV